MEESEEAHRLGAEREFAESCRSPLVVQRVASSLIPASRTFPGLRGGLSAPRQLKGRATKSRTGAARPTSPGEGRPREIDTERHSRPGYIDEVGAHLWLWHGLLGGLSSDLENYGPGTVLLKPLHITPPFKKKLQESTWSHMFHLPAACLTEESPDRRQYSCVRDLPSRLQERHMAWVVPKSRASWCCVSPLR